MMQTFRNSLVVRTDYFSHPSSLLTKNQILFYWTKIETHKYVVSISTSTKSQRRNNDHNFNGLWNNHQHGKLFSYHAEKYGKLLNLLDS